MRVSGGHLCEAEAPTEATAETGVPSNLNTFPKGAPQGVNSKTVLWTVLEEGTPCKRGRPLILHTKG